MNPNEQYALNWSNHTNHIRKAFDTLLAGSEFVDVTLTCEGKKITAHKILLSACSSYFHNLFRDNPCQHPIVILRDVKFQNLVDILKFMYNGEVSVAQDNLESFLKTAELLQVSGLTDEDNKLSSDSVLENFDLNSIRNKDSNTSANTSKCVESSSGSSTFSNVTIKSSERNERREFKRRTTETRKEDEEGASRKKNKTDALASSPNVDINIKQETETVSIEEEAFDPLQLQEKFEEELDDSQADEPYNYEEQQDMQQDTSNEIYLEERYIPATHSQTPMPSRLFERHFPDFIPPTLTQQRPTKRCGFCSRKKIRRESRYWCAECQKGLCAVPCFRLYHTQE